MTVKQSPSRQSPSTRLAAHRILLLLSLCFLLGLCVSTFPIFILTSSSISLPFYSPLIYESSKQQTFQSCPHILLFSSARHGSTWFIDSVDSCRYSTSAREDKPFSDNVFLTTEPWKHKKSRLANISGAEVADYVRQNASVKIFSSTLSLFRPRVEQLLESVAQSIDIPVVILRREPNSTFRSLQVASETGNWNNRKGPEQVIKIGAENEKEFRGYTAHIEQYFQGIQKLLAEKNVGNVDIVNYDDIKDLEYIKLENNQCYIRNCNFRKVNLKTKQV